MTFCTGADADENGADVPDIGDFSRFVLFVGRQLAFGNLMLDAIVRSLSFLCRLLQYCRKMTGSIPNRNHGRWLLNGNPSPPSPVPFIFTPGDEIGSTTPSRLDFCLGRSKVRSSVLHLTNL